MFKNIYKMTLRLRKTNYHKLWLIPESSTKQAGNK